MAVKRAVRKVKKKRIATKKTVTPKAIAPSVEKIDFTDSMQQVSKTVKAVNKEMRHAFTEVASDLMENGIVIGKASAQSVKTLATKVNKAVTVKNIQKTTKNIMQTSIDLNEYTINTAEEFVDGALTTGQKWQNVADKAVKGGLKLAAKQQTMVFDTLDSVKGQFASNLKRAKKLFSKN